MLIKIFYTPSISLGDQHSINIRQSYQNTSSWIRVQLGISGRSDQQQMLPWINYGIDRRLMLTTVQGVFTCDTIDTLTLRNIFGSSGGRACGRGIRASTKAKSNISTIKFCNPSYYSFTCTISESIIFMTSPSTCPYLQ